MLVYIVIFFIWIFALYKEREFLGCHDLLAGLPGRHTCNNEKAYTIEDYKPLRGDSCQDIYNKTLMNADAFTNIVVWRRSFIMAVIIAVLGEYVSSQKLISEKKLVAYTVVGFAVMYFSYGYYAFHQGRFMKKNVQTGLDLLTIKKC